MAQETRLHGLKIVLGDDGSLAVGKPVAGGGWTAHHQPAAATKATASKAAVAAVRNVCQGLSFWVNTLAVAPAAQDVTVVLRDGATGAGTILASWTVRVPATANTNLGPFALTGLWIEGSVNTAMTLETSVDAGANVQAGVNINGTTTS